jgi:hypothetical protein
MGFWRSFTSGAGVHAGRRVSQAVLGDGMPKSSKQEKRQLALEQDRLEIEQKQLGIEQKQQKDAMLEQLSNKVEDKILQINMLDIPNDKNALINLLNQLALLLKANPFKDSSNAKQRISNAYSDAILTKYEQAFMTFMSNCSSDSRAEYYMNILKSTKRWRLVKKYRLVIVLLVIVIAITIFVLANS